MTLGDKIVVMDAGKIQQVGTPYQIFHQPHNMFVASFVGSPSMNILTGRLSQNGQLQVQTEGWSQPVPDRFTSKANIVLPNQVHWGIRPEHIKLVDGSGSHDVAGRVNVVEPMGSRDLLLVKAGPNAIKVMAEAESMGRYKVGDRCFLRFPEEYVHIFDSTTGISLLECNS